MLTKKIVFLGLAALVLLYTLLGFVILPAVLIDQVPKIFQENFGRNAQVKEIKFNPYSLELEILGFEIHNHDKSVFVRLERVYTNVALWESIIDGIFKMDQLLIEQPTFLIQRDKKGNFNFTDLIGDEQVEEEASEESDLFPIIISELVVSEGKLTWEDSSHAQVETEVMYPINLNVDNFTTIVNSHSQLGFSVILDSGGELDWQGKFALVPFDTKGHIKLDKLNIPRILRVLFHDEFNFKLHQGSELVETDYHLYDSPQGMQILLNNAHINIHDFQLGEKGSNEPLIVIPDFSISGMALDLLKKNVEIARISAKDARFTAWLNADGSINYQALFASDNATSDEPAQQEQSANEVDDPWQVKVQQLSLENLAFNFTDNIPVKPVHLDLTSLNLDATDLSNKAGAVLPFKLGLAFNKGGQLHVEGQAVLEPFSSQIQVDISDIAIKDFQPYIDQFIRLDVISGLFNVNIQVSINQPEDQPVAISLLGDSSITDFVTRDRVTKKDFLKWKQLSLINMDMDLSANSFKIDTIKIEHPYARVLIRKDKSMNFDDVLLDTPPAEKEPEQPKSAANEEAAKPYFKIGLIDIVGGESDFSDLSLILPFSAHINQLKGTVKGISSEQKAITNVALKGLLHDLTPVTIGGILDPHRKSSEFNLEIRSMPLALMSPYMVEFAGRKIEKGNMTLGLTYALKDRQLLVTNSLLIDQLVLGEEVENPDAVSLPLDLAIALLEDVDGKITLNVPISGSLDNPDFSVAGIIVDALVNVITKIVTSPFSAIASLIGDDADVSKIEFAAGKEVLTEAEQSKLTALSEALVSRPALILDIEGTAFSKQDWPELQLEALALQLQQIKLAELNQDNEDKVLLENITLSDEEYQSLLADLFIEKFPEIGERSFLGTPQLIDEEAGDFYEVAEQRLAVIIPPNRQRLQKLAKLRAKAIAKYLVENGLEIERVFLHDVDIDPQEADGTIASVLTLSVK